MRPWRIRQVLLLHRAASADYLKRNIWQSCLRRYSRVSGASTLFGMQRLFSMFPRGWPGIGLLLLRMSVAGACVLACAGCEACTAWVLAGLFPLCASLCVGALTPLAAALAVGLELAAAAKLCLSGSGVI